MNNGAITIVTVVQHRGEEPVFCEEPLIYEDTEEAYDNLIDNYYNSDEWELYERVVNKKKQIFVFQNVENKQLFNTIFVNVISDKQFEKIKKILLNGYI